MMNTNTNTEEVLPLKQTAERYECAYSTLKEWLKKELLTSMRKGDSGPHLLNCDDVERLLRGRPEVKSKFNSQIDAPKELATPLPQPKKLVTKTQHPLERNEQGSGLVMKGKKAKPQMTKSPASKHRLPALEWLSQKAVDLPVEDQVRLRNRLTSNLENFN